MSEMEGRVRTLTPGGHELYQANLQSYLSTLKKAWRVFEAILTGFDDSRSDIKYLREIEEKFEKAKSEYMESYETLISFLRRSRTDEGDSEMDNQIIRHKKCVSVINNFDHQIQDLLIDAAEIFSEKSETRSELSISNSSRRSSASEKKQQGTMTQLKKLQYAEKETELQKQKALLEAKIRLLECQKNVDSLKAEIDGLEDQGSQIYVPSLPERHPLDSNDSLRATKREYTANYVSEH
ncbi:uncharacterized protein LOC134271898 [Saccostrea cucullata]|uniref:uncharacterized protein LOC134271898 n=1 Tax=Saccostrea cuccullata TaxID=36930 RepID=UPI002ED224F9